MARAAKEIRLFDPQGRQRGGQLADAVPAQLIRGVDRQLGVGFADDFAFFTEGAGDDVDVGAVGSVVRDGAAGRQRFVVRVGVDEEQTGRFLAATSASPYRRGGNGSSVKRTPQFSPY